MQHPIFNISDKESNMAKFLQKNLLANGVDFVLGNGKALSADLTKLPKAT